MQRPLPLFHFLPGRHSNHLLRLGRAAGSQLAEIVHGTHSLGVHLSFAVRNRADSVIFGRFWLMGLAKATRHHMRFTAWLLADHSSPG